MMVDSRDIPDGATLLALEKSSGKGGSGLGRDDLIGTWRLDRLWSKGRTDPSHAAGTALRALSACLGLEDGKDGGLRLSNTIALGPLKLRFQGPAELRGRRPLLVFQFQTLRLSLAGHPLWTLSLPRATPGREPFFALIASQRNRGEGCWLAARGRGGGLALWVREEDAAP
jgi:hypothetical protein